MSDESKMGTALAVGLGAVGLVGLAAYFLGRDVKFGAVKYEVTYKDSTGDTKKTIVEADSYASARQGVGNDSTKEVCKVDRWYTDDEVLNIAAKRFPELSMVLERSDLIETVRDFLSH